LLVDTFGQFFGSVPELLLQVAGPSEVLLTDVTTTGLAFIGREVVGVTDWRVLFAFAEQVIQVTVEVLRHTTPAEGRTSVRQAIDQHTKESPD